MEMVEKDSWGMGASPKLSTRHHRRAARATSLAAACLTFILAATVHAAPPASQPADPTMDWLMNQATTKPAMPATAPVSPPPSPFAAKTSEDARLATLTLSNGKRVVGRFTTTDGKPIRIWDEAEKEYHDIPFDLIRSMQAKITWERQQPEWHFKASGSDVKEYTGKTYPAHEMQYVVTLVNGQQLTGGIVAPLYQENAEGGTTLFVLHKRDKGNVGQTLQQLVYVQRVEFGPPATQPATQP